MSNESKTKSRKPAVEHRRDAAQKAILERRRARGKGEQADWGVVDSGLLSSVVGTITRAGFAIQFGYTADGGAYRIRLVGGGDVSDDYVRPTEDLDYYLKALLADFGGDY